MSLITTKSFYQLLIIFCLIFMVLKINKSNQTKDVNYANLERLLSIQDWEGADYETSILMQEITNQHRHILYPIEKFLGLNQFHQPIIVSNIPCKDLLKIDNLWTQYSKNRLGFTVQRNILKPLASELEVETVEDKDAKVHRRIREILKWKGFYLADRPGEEDEERNKKHYQKVKNIPISRIPYGYLPYKLYSDTMFLKLVTSWGYIDLPYTIMSTVEKVEDCSNVKSDS